MIAPRITPGLWRANGLAVRTEDGEVSIARIALSYCADTVAAANARLIAAAPALAAALAALLPWAEQAWARAQATRLPGDEPPALNAARDALEAAGYEPGP